MQQYHPREYENVFSEDPPNSPNKLNFDKIDIVGMELNPYILLCRKFLGDFYLSRFDGYVRFSWLRRAFCYYGNRTVLPMNKNSIKLNDAFLKLMRRSVGKDPQTITKRTDFGRIESYFDELYPEFLERNPFQEPEYYKFPYQNISMDFLLVVYQMENRLELLKNADELNLPIAKFMDKVDEYVMAENAKLPESRYLVKHTTDHHFPFYVVDLNKRKKKRK
jgi:hypothetical protein